MSITFLNVFKNISGKYFPFMGQFFYLVFVGIINLFYNLGLFINEVITFSSQPWWRKLHWKLFWAYIDDGPYLIVKKEGKRAPVLGQNLIYGETPCLTIKAILEEAEIKSSDHFVDLGCGRGLTVFFVNQHFHIPSTGIEIIPTFIKRAEKITKELKLTQVKFIKENLSWVTLDDIGQGTVFYLTGTTFEEELLAKIASRLELLTIGVKLITLSEALPSTQFTVTKIKTFYFSWGKTDVYFHEKTT